MNTYSLYPLLWPVPLAHAQRRHRKRARRPLALDSPTGSPSGGAVSSLALFAAASPAPYQVVQILEEHDILQMMKVTDPNVITYEERDNMLGLQVMLLDTCTWKLTVVKENKESHVVEAGRTTKSGGPATRSTAPCSQPTPCTRSSSMFQTSAFATQRWSRSSSRSTSRSRGRIGRCWINRNPYGQRPAHHS